MFRVPKQQGTRKVEEKLRKDPLKSMRPDLPINGPGMEMFVFAWHTFRVLSTNMAERGRLYVNNKSILPLL